MTENALLVLGVSLVFGLIARALLETKKIPSAVGYILVGLLLGRSFLNFISPDVLHSLSYLTDLALGMIGFLVGAELEKTTFKKYGRRFFLILLAEGTGAMIGVFLLTYVLTRNFPLSVLLGALSSATSPAGTVDVIWESRAKGPLTTTILAIVALDDALALILYAFAVSVAKLSITGAPLSFRNVIVVPGGEIFASLLLGAVVGLPLAYLIRYVRDREVILLAFLGGLMLVDGVAEKLHLSLILSSMMMGTVITNISTDSAARAFGLFKNFVPPFILWFLVFAGAMLDAKLLPKVGLIGALYVIGRTAGKMGGSWFGAVLSRAEESVRKYLGLALFCQAGVVFGLMIEIAKQFSSFQGGQEMVDTIVTVITSITIVLQLLGPWFVRFALERAGEVNLAREGDEK